MRILTAEDDLTTRNMLSAVLAKQGHEVVATVDGAEAWELLQQPDAPRLAILDWMMPRMDGVEVCRLVRGIDTDRPPYLILLTVLEEAGHVVAGLEAGADDYVTKPFHPAEVRARVAVGERILAMQDRLCARADELREALDQVKTLRGLIPICCHCKRIRDDGDYWREVEEYVEAHSEASFTHGVCPTCMEKHYSIPKE